MSSFVGMLGDESGAALAEYALVSAGFALAAATALAAIAYQCGIRLGATSSGLTALGTTPP